MVHTYEYANTAARTGNERLLRYPLFSFCDTPGDSKSSTINPEGKPCYAYEVYVHHVVWSWFGVYDGLQLLFHFAVGRGRGWAGQEPGRALHDDDDDFTEGIAKSRTTLDGYVVALCRDSCFAACGWVRESDPEGTLSLGRVGRSCNLRFSRVVRSQPNV